MFAPAHTRILRLELQERIELTRGCWGSMPVFLRQRLSVERLHSVERTARNRTRGTFTEYLCTSRRGKAHSIHGFGSRPISRRAPVLKSASERLYCL